jgi:hypothetical protein
MDNSSRHRHAALPRRANFLNWYLPIVALALALALCACGGGEGSSGNSGGQSGGGSSGGGNPPPVVVAPSGLSYTNPQIYIAATAITDLSPVITGAATLYTIAPALPPGLTLDQATGKISGTPTAQTATTDYLITASNSAGKTTFTLTFTVYGQPFNSNMLRLLGNWKPQNANGSPPVTVELFPKTTGYYHLAYENDTPPASTACGTPSYYKWDDSYSAVWSDMLNGTFNCSAEGDHSGTVGGSACMAQDLLSITQVVMPPPPPTSGTIVYTDGDKKWVTQRLSLTTRCAFLDYYLNVGVPFIGSGGAAPSAQTTLENGLAVLDRPNGTQELVASQPGVRDIATTNYLVDIVDADHIVITYYISNLDVYSGLTPMLAQSNGQVAYHLRFQRAP